MENEANQLILEFFTIVDKLKSMNVVWSDRYLGDIGEFLAARKYGVKLSDNLREPTIDGYIGKQSVQIKYSGSPTGTNINVGNADFYDILILVLTNSSLHYPDDAEFDLVTYKIDMSDLIREQLKTEKGNYYISKSKLIDHAYHGMSFSDL